MNPCRLLQPVDFAQLTMQLEAVPVCSSPVLILEFEL